MGKLIVAKRVWWQRGLAYLASLIAVGVISFPFVFTTVTRVTKDPISYAYTDDFVPCWDYNCMNGGIRTDYWSFEYGDGSKYAGHLQGWGNEERQCYTSDNENVQVVPHPDKPNDGILQITALYQERPACNWTSARMITKDRLSFVWVRDKYNLYTVSMNVEARIKVSMEMGSWSAFWMLPQPPQQNRTCLGCGVYGGWCNSGEIDIMEHVNNEESVVVGNVYKETDGCNVNIQPVPVKNMSAWHDYKVQWTGDFMKYFVDGELVRTAPLPTNVTNPFTQPFYMIFNLAIGGRFPGNNIALRNHSMYVDWVKAYYL